MATSGPYGYLTLSWLQAVLGVLPLVHGVLAKGAARVRDHCSQFQVCRGPGQGIRPAAGRSNTCSCMQAVLGVLPLVHGVLAQGAARVRDHRSQLQIRRGPGQGVRAAADLPPLALRQAGRQRGRPAAAQHPRAGSAQPGVPWLVCCTTSSSSAGLTVESSHFVKLAAKEDGLLQRSIRELDMHSQACICLCAGLFRLVCVSLVLPLHFVRLAANEDRLQRSFCWRCIARCVAAPAIRLSKTARAVRIELIPAKQLASAGRHLLSDSLLPTCVGTGCLMLTPGFKLCPAAKRSRCAWLHCSLSLPGWRAAVLSSRGCAVLRHDGVRAVALQQDQHPHRRRVWCAHSRNRPLCQRACLQSRSACCCCCLQRYPVLWLQHCLLDTKSRGLSLLAVCRR